jgi:hypothetical protein
VFDGVRVSASRCASPGRRHESAPHPPDRGLLPGARWRKQTALSQEISGPRTPAPARAKPRNRAVSGGLVAPRRFAVRRSVPRSSSASRRPPGPSRLRSFTTRGTRPVGGYSWATGSLVRVGNVFRVSGTAACWPRGRGLRDASVLQLRLASLRRGATHFLAPPLVRGPFRSSGFACFGVAASHLLHRLLPRAFPPGR